MRFLDANNLPLANDFVVMRSSDGSVLQPIADEHGGYSLSGVGRKLTLEFTPKGLKQRSIELVLVRAPKVYVTMVVDPDSGRVKEIRQKPYFPAPKINPKIKTGSLGGIQGIVVPPANNACASPLPITVGATAYDTSEATTDGPANGCGSGSQVHNDIWYSFTAPGTGVVTISTCNTAAYDTAIAIYNGLSCPPAAPLSCNDDFGGCAGFTSQTSAGVIAGQNYLFRIGGFGASSKGTGTLNVSFSGPPAFDECAGATTVACNTQTTVSSASATTNGTDPAFSCRFGGPGQGFGSIWFKFVAVGATATLNTSASVVSDTMMALYSGTCGALAEIACDDDSGTGLRSLINAAGLTAGNTYYVQVAGFGASDVGSITLDLQCSAGPPPGDDCADAIPTACGSNAVVDNSLYTTDPLDPGYSCHFFGPGNQGVGTVWFTFVATHTSARLDTNLSLAFDTLLAVYDGTCGAFTELACSEDEGVGLLSELCVTGLTVGNTYYVQASSFSDLDRGEITLRIQCPCPLPPENDSCSGAESIALPSSTVFDNSLATDDIGVPCGVASGPFKNVWFTLAGTGNSITATTCNGGTAVSDTKISVFCGSCIAGLTCVNGNDDACAAGGPIFASTVTWCSQIGATYYITVGTFSPDTPAGQIQLDVFQGGVCVPVVQCLPTGACCLPNSTCVTTTSDNCAALGGTYSGDGTACTTDFMVDGSFEGGTPSAAWNEASTNFGTPICDPFACGFGGGTGPRTGNFWAWFGGIPAMEVGSVDQNITIPANATSLDFYLEIPVSSGNGIDFVRLEIDGINVFEAKEGEAPYAGIGYQLVSIPLGAFADGGVHNVRFESTQTGSPGITNFFVDDISLLVQTTNCTTCYTLDFETDDTGAALVDKQQIAGGEFDGGANYPVTITSASYLATCGSIAGTAAVYDSDAPPHGQDPDLAVDSGNILILQTDANLSFCGAGIYCSGNDDEDGGLVTFSFNVGVEPGSIDLIDVDASSGAADAVVITMTDGDGDTRTYSVPAGWTGDLVDDGVGQLTLMLNTTAAQPGFIGSATAVEDAGFDQTDVVSIVVNRGDDCPNIDGGSGAVDNLTWCQ